jgi:hypothetical protein
VRRVRYCALCVGWRRSGCIERRSVRLCVVRIGTLLTVSLRAKAASVNNFLALYGQYARLRERLLALPEVRVLSCWRRVLVMP